MRKLECTKCHNIVNETEFRFKSKVNNIRQKQCKTCCKLAGKRHYTKNRSSQIHKQINRNISNRQIFVAFKKTLNCEVCGESAWYCLDFHHLDPEHKDFDLSSQTHSWSRVVEEAQKCICVCTCCHRKIHYGDLQPKFSTYLAQKISEFLPPS